MTRLSQICRHLSASAYVKAIFHPGFLVSSTPVRPMQDKIDFEKKSLATTASHLKSYTSIPAKLSPILENALNEQIALELTSALLYFGMSAWFSRPDVGLPGLAHYFRHNSSEEMEHARKLCKYQVMRLATPKFTSLPQHLQLDRVEWPSALEAMEAAVMQEERLLENLNGLVRASEEEGEKHLADYLITEFVDEQLKDIAAKLEMCTQLRRVGTGDGLSVYDRSLLSDSESGDD